MNTLCGSAGLFPPIAIFGFGVTGRAVAKFCDHKGWRYTVFDEAGHGGAQKIFTAATARRYGTVVRSPGFAKEHKWVQVARSCGCRCITELDLASQFWSGKIIAVTGTNGKTTTAEFLTHALTVAGQRAIVCGNIGTTFIAVADSAVNSSEAWAVVEVSSFQMDGDSIFRPDYVLWTNFARDHMDVHGTMEEYFNCKANLLRNVKGAVHERCFVGPSVDAFCQRLPGSDVLGQYLVCLPVQPPPENTVFTFPPQKDNFTIVRQFWSSIGFDNSALVAAAKSFQLPAHRLHMVASVNVASGNGTMKTVEFWDDSKATNFHALDAALNAFGKKVILIAGGKSKDEPLEDFLDIISGRVKFLLLIGDVGGALFSAVKKSHDLSKNVQCEVFSKNFSVARIIRDVVYRAGMVADNGDVVLLSPGFSSLDWFKDYSERGKFFEDSVLCLNFLNK